MVSSSHLAAIERLALTARWEFDSALDYVWKAPTLIEQLTSIELRKLAEYYPNESRARDFRWKMESEKLRRVFPALLSHASLFAVCSLFEMYVFQLATEVQPFATDRLDKASAQGIRGYLTIIRRGGVGTSRLGLWPQVDAALKVRNCLMHARGILSHSRNASEIRRIVENRTFLTPDHREAWGLSARALPRIKITRSKAGDRLEITNAYAWISCAYFRDYFVSLCDASKEAIRATNPAS